MPFQIPSWLDVSPSDYLRATQSGAQMGHAIAESTQRAWEEQARMQMAAQQQEARMQQLAVENAQQRLAADRLDEYRQQEMQNAQDRLGIEKQRLGSIDVAQKRADELARHNLALEESRLSGKQYGEPKVFDVGGGAKFVYREGSPGGHLLTPKGSVSLTPGQSVDLIKSIPQIQLALRTGGTNSLMSKYGQPLLDRAFSGLDTGTIAPSTNSGKFKIVKITKQPTVQPNYQDVSEVPSDEEE